jgi:ribonuclease-3
VGDDLYGNGVGRSKKEAEQAAAETAYSDLSGLDLASSADD